MIISYRLMRKPLLKQLFEMIMWRKGARKIYFAYSTALVSRITETRI